MGGARAGGGAKQPEDASGCPERGYIYPHVRHRGPNFEGSLCPEEILPELCCMKLNLEATDTGTTEGRRPGLETRQPQREGRSFRWKSRR